LQRGTLGLQIENSNPLMMKALQNPDVDKYLLDGCMRCKYGGTPQCKVHDWHEELILLRELVLECGLTEEVKWGVPCYTFEGKNVVVVSAFKEYACLSFFKGVLMADPQSILVQRGESSQSARLIKFTCPEEIHDQRDVLKSYILEAVKVEKSGKKVELKKNPEPMPEELLQFFENDSEYEHAFYELTPGRQRGYIIYFSQSNKPQTRLTRIEKYRDQILNGVGLHDKYKP
jgi:uncharacterized protein YdeI (YjbR/CyaY-like superfamily)